MSDFSPGDVVVCVDASGQPGLAPVNLTEGRVYRLSWVGVDWLDGSTVVRCVGVVAKTQTGFFAARRFRKIRPADEQFTETVRACKPIKQREPANA